MASRSASSVAASAAVVIERRHLRQPQQGGDARGILGLRGGIGIGACRGGIVEVALRAAAERQLRIIDVARKVLAPLAEQRQPARDRRPALGSARTVEQAAALADVDRRGEQRVALRRPARLELVEIPHRLGTASVGSGGAARVEQRLRALRRRSGCGRRGGLTGDRQREQ